MKSTEHGENYVEDVLQKIVNNVGRLETKGGEGALIEELQNKLEKQDEVIKKQDEVIKKQDEAIKKQDEAISEVKASIISSRAALGAAGIIGNGSVMAAVISSPLSLCQGAGIVATSIILTVVACVAIALLPHAK